MVVPAPGGPDLRPLRFHRLAVAAGRKKLVQRIAGASGDDSAHADRDLSRGDQGCPSWIEGERGRAGCHVVGAHLASDPDLGSGRNLRRNDPGAWPRPRRDHRSDDGHRQSLCDSTLDLLARIHARKRDRQRVQRGDRNALPGRSDRAWARAHPRHARRQRGGAPAGPLDLARSEPRRMNRNVRRRYASRAWLGGMYLLTLVALVPLGLVLWFTVSKGLPPALHIEFFTNSFRPYGIPGGGVAHAIVGTGILVGLASLMAIPIGIIGGVYVAEYAVDPWASWVRLASDVLVGTPSIAIGLFAYALVVVPVHHFSGIAGSVALAILMLPIVIRTTEGAVALIPNGLRESGLALGLPRWRVSLQLILPAAAPGVITGALLAVARASGETAPLLFTSLGNTLFRVDPTNAIQALPLTVYQSALLPYHSLHYQASGAP